MSINATDDQKRALLDKNEINDMEKDPQATSIEVSPTEGKSRDPLHVKKISLGSDYYSLTWACLKYKLFEEKYIRGEKIFLLPSDYFHLYFEFVVFILMLAITIVLVIRNVVIDDTYMEGSVAIIGCRIILMIFAMQSIGPEFSTGFAKYMYTVNNKSEFTYPGFAKFVGLCQVTNAGIATFGVLFFVCTADDFGSLLTCFSGLCVLTELDDWLGDMILSCHKIKDDDYPEDEADDSEDVLAEKQKTRQNTLKLREGFNLKDLNERLGVLEKMATIEEGDLTIYVTETFEENQIWIIKFCEKINSYAPLEIILPLMTIPMSYCMPWIQQNIMWKFL